MKVGFHPALYVEAYQNAPITTVYFVFEDHGSESEQLVLVNSFHLFLGTFVPRTMLSTNLVVYEYEIRTFRNSTLLLFGDYGSESKPLHSGRRVTKPDWPYC